MAAISFFGWKGYSTNGPRRAQNRLLAPVPTRPALRPNASYATWSEGLSHIVLRPRLRRLMPPVHRHAAVGRVHERCATIGRRRDPTKRTFLRSAPTRGAGNMRLPRGDTPDETWRNWKNKENGAAEDLTRFEWSGDADVDAPSRLSLPRSPTANRDMTPAW